MAKKLDWKMRWLIIMAGIVIMMLGQGNLFWIIIGASVALIGLYYGTKDTFLAYLKGILNRLWKRIRGYLPPF